MYTKYLLRPNLNKCGFLQRQNARFATISTPYESTQKLCLGSKLKFINPQSPLRLEEVNKWNLKDYQFPRILFKYGKDDVLGHNTAGVGLKETDKDWIRCTTDPDLDSKNFLVLPSFFDLLKAYVNAQIVKIPQLETEVGLNVQAESSLLLHKSIPPVGEVTVDV